MEGGLVEKGHLVNVDLVPQPASSPTRRLIHRGIVNDLRAHAWAIVHYLIPDGCLHAGEQGLLNLIKALMERALLCRADELLLATEH
jgi:hypothetical protein